MQLPMKAHGYPGTLITFCGLDGSGKTTLINRLRTELERRGASVMLTKQPTDFVRRSAMFRTYMDTADRDRYDYRALSLLCASDRVQHCNRVIRPLLAEGHVVICDRYYYSCLANLWARGFQEDRWIYEVAESIPRPDAAFFLKLDPAQAIRRVRSRPAERGRFIDTELQYRLDDAFGRIARSNGGVSVYTHLPEEVCHEAVIEKTKEVMDHVSIHAHLHLDSAV